MGTLNTFIKAIKSFDIEKACNEALKQNEKKILDINREQLIEGKFSNDKPIRPKYASKKYAAKKQSMNSRPKYGTPDLKLTGDFHKSLYLDGITVKSNDKKAKQLEHKYNSYISSMYGINTKFVKEIRKLTLPEVQKKFKEHAMRM
jgi:3-methyladenine DNA glycosylase AlkD